MKDNRRARSARGCQDRRSDLCTLLRRSCSRPLLPHSLQAASPVALKRDLTSFSTSCALPCWCFYCLERGAAMTRRPQRSSSRCARSPRLIRLLKPCSARRDPPAIQQRKACVFSHLPYSRFVLQVFLNPCALAALTADVWQSGDRLDARHAVWGARGQRWAASSPRRARRSFPMALRSIRALGSSRRTANWPSRISVQAEHVFQAAPRAEPPLPPVHATWRLEAPQRIVRAAKGSEHSPPRAAAACAATRRAPWNCLKPADLIQQWFSKIHQWFSKIHQWFY